MAERSMLIVCAFSCFLPVCPFLSNQFETSTSCGTLSTSSRTQWENALFNKIYAKASGYERVKVSSEVAAANRRGKTGPRESLLIPLLSVFLLMQYGVLNIVQDPNGVIACRPYGDSYLLLRSDRVRLRTSFASKDTGGGTAQLASCEWYAHVLAEYSDPELADVVSVATKAKRCVSSARITSYKEVQYHGPLEFARDVEALVVNGRHASDKAMMKMAQEFCTNNNCNLILTEADDGR